MRSIIAFALVTAFFLLSAAVMPIVVRRLVLSPRKKKILVAACIFSVCAKMAITLLSIATIPEARADYTTWKTVAGLMAEHKSIYAETNDDFCRVSDRGCYNFAPGWAWIAFGLSELANRLHGQSIAAFRLVLTAFLATTDVLIGLLLAYGYSSTAALVFLLAPLFTWLETSEGPFNNLALLVALVAWLQIRKKEPTRQAVFLSAVLTGLSLVIKHILFLFPLWLLFHRPLGKTYYRLEYAVVAYGIFFCSFIPWWKDPASRAGIIERVFGYNGNYGDSLLGRITEHLVSISTLDEFFVWLPLSSFKLFWIIFLFAIGVIAAKRNTKELLLCYLLALYGFSISLFDEYLVIPMLVCSIFYKSWASWAFMLTSTALMVIVAGSNFIYYNPFLHNLPHLVVVRGNYGWQGIFMSICDFLYRPLVFASQSCIIVLFMLRWRDRFGPEAGLPPSAMMLRSAGLALTTSAASALPSVARLVWPHT